jgi:hypothetical protein
MPDKMQAIIPEDVPDITPEDMSDRMPEDLPVAKCINVMVGITRSKVIWFETSLYQGGRATRPQNREPTFCLDLNQGEHEVQLFL